jgi:hypothetical protein
MFVQPCETGTFVHSSDATAANGFLSPNLARAGSSLADYSEGGSGFTESFKLLSPDRKDIELHSHRPRLQCRAAGGQRHRHRPHAPPRTWLAGLRPPRPLVAQNGKHTAPICRFAHKHETPPDNPTDPAARTQLRRSAAEDTCEASASASALQEPHCLPGRLGGFAGHATALAGAGGCGLAMHRGLRPALILACPNVFFGARRPLPWSFPCAFRSRPIAGAPVQHALGSGESGRSGARLAAAAETPAERESGRSCFRLRPKGAPSFGRGRTDSRGAAGRTARTRAGSGPESGRIRLFAGSAFPPSCNSPASDPRSIMIRAGHPPKYQGFKGADRGLSDCFCQYRSSECGCRGAGDPTIARGCQLSVDLRRRWEPGGRG